VANRTDVYVRLGPLKLALCHFGLPSKERIVNCDFNLLQQVAADTHASAGGTIIISLSS